MFSNYKIKQSAPQYLSLLVILYLFTGHPVKSNIVWQETFDNFDTFRLTHGAVEIRNGELVGTECVIFGIIGSADLCGVSMWINSTAMTGTWSVDFYLFDPATSFLAFYFIGEGVLSTSGVWQNSDYTLFIFGTDYQVGTIHLGYHHNDGAGWREKLDYDLSVGWMHIDVS